MDPILKSVREYWDSYAEGLEVAGAERGSLEFFTQIKILHDQAYGYANRILDFDQLRGKNLLELAPGVGLDTVEFAAHGAKVTAIDLSPGCLALAKMSLACRNLDATLELGNAEELSYPDKQFDVGVARGLFMYTRDDRKLLDELLRVLRPGGIVQILLHNRRSWYVVLARLSGSNLFTQAGDPPINRIYTVGEARRVAGRFSTYDLYYDRFPSPQSSRTGVAAWLFEKLFGPFSRMLPKARMEPMGFYMIIKAVK